MIDKIGRGGFGEVWLAERQSEFLTKKVAVKLPLEEQVDFEAIRREANLWEQASGHPNVLPIIDADIYDGQVVIVSEYADGGSLSDLIKSRGSVQLTEALDLTIGILNGLGFLHGRQIIHRDIKPQNILLQGDTPRLADFGISRVMSSTTLSSVVVGTDSYMAPEAFDGKRNVQTDVWSVGVVFYQLLKGRLPFPQDHPSERMYAVLAKEFEPLPHTIPSSYRSIVKKALEKLPENRYLSADEMKRDLLAVRNGVALAVEPVGEEYTRVRLPNNSLPPTMVVSPSSEQWPQPYIQQTPPQLYNYQRLHQGQMPIARTFGEGKVISGFCYLGNIVCFIGLILSIITVCVERQHKLPRFHAIQSMLLSGVYIFVIFANTVLINMVASARLESLAGFLGIIYGLSLLVLFICLIVGIIQGFRGQMTKLPLIGGLAERWA
ncbi:MAG: protein kinase domain-containing protein [Pyrinomonadaceae bacterium]